MKVTKVFCYYPKNPESKILAYASVTLDDVLTIHSIMLIAKEDKTFITFPERIVTTGYNENKKTRKLAYIHPNNNELRTDIHRAIVNVYVAANPTCEHLLTSFDDQVAKPIIVENVIETEEDSIVIEE